MIDLPRFAVIRHDDEGDFWSMCSEQLTYKEANEEFKRLRGKGTRNLYLVRFTFIAGPGDEL